MRASAFARHTTVAPLALLAWLAATAATEHHASAQVGSAPAAPTPAPKPAPSATPSPATETSGPATEPFVPAPVATDPTRPFPGIPRPGLDPGVTYQAKKDYRLQKKQRATTDSAARQRWRQQLDERIGVAPAPIVNVYSLWHHETLPVEVTDELRAELRRSLPSDVVPQRSGNRLLRCHFTQEPTDIDPRLLAVVTRAALHFGVDRVNVVSGYRAPKYNLILQKKGREVARSSQHSLGHAIDFRLPGVNIKRLHRFVRGLRLGGVGFYTHSKFIHADVGPVRYWTGR